MTQDNELTARERGQREAIRRGWLTPEDTDCADTGTGTVTDDDGPRAKALRWLQRNGKTLG